MEQSADKPKKKWYLRWWMIVIYVLLVLSFIGTLGGSKNAATSVSTAQQATPEPAIVVTSDKLASDYKDNQVAADAKYKDKIVEVTGTVDSIGKDITDSSYVTFEGESQYSVINKVQAFFSKSNESALIDVKKGQKLTLRGRVEGGSFNVILRDSEIVP